MTKKGNYLFSTAPKNLVLIAIKK